MENLIKSLNKLGLSRYEAQAYIGLTKIIRGKAEEIAEISQLPRSRIYDILKELEKKGFVEIKKGRPMIYTVVEPKIIFKKEKEKLLENLNSTENKLNELYTDEITEIQAPVWLIHNPDNIISKEMEIIKKANRYITIRIGFLLEKEGQNMIKTFQKIPKNVKICILANPVCYVEDKKIDIIKIFKDAKLDNLEILKADLPMMKMMIIDGREMFGTFAKFEGENNSIIPQTAIGVNNKYSEICNNFHKHFMRQFKKLKQMNM